MMRRIQMSSKWLFCYKEDDTAGSFQLLEDRASVELYPTPTFVENRQIHRAVARENQLDKRFFVRA